MTRSKLDRSVGERGEPVRQRVLDAAERLLRSGGAEFSMRDLAAEAEVSFATPFNQFGGKAGIMHALSARRIDAMAARLRDATPPIGVGGRVRLAVETAAAVMLAEPAINRAVMGWIGTCGAPPEGALGRSAAYWAMALEGAEAGGHAGREVDLSRRLAFAFRGALSFWTAGELSDEEFRLAALDVAGSLADAASEDPLNKERAGRGGTARPEDAGS